MERYTMLLSMDVNLQSEKSASRKRHISRKDTNTTSDFPQQSRQRVFVIDRRITGSLRSFNNAIKVPSCASTASWDCWS